MSLRNRGRVGLKGVRKRQQERTAIRETGEKLEAAQLSHAAELLETFKTQLTAFAEEHRESINSDPQFRRYFHRMCSGIGVDPLNSQKGFWAEYLHIGDFYYELAVQITEICLATRDLNGGVLPLSDLLEQLRKKRESQAGDDASGAISGSDVLTAVAKLKVLGGGIRVEKVGGRRMIFSVPMELSRDEMAAMEVAQRGGGYFTAAALREEGWSDERIDRAVATLLQQEMVWLDAGAAEGGESYWFVSLFNAGDDEDLDAEDA
eukprot:CAMPEP_0118882372 /NCGR_PEP_ID=MMETSP1163-20130328/21642_1 /TAXON_ID=124430 /ORGANISM="Phaeomonas parva, Strain CCMP2877" /LENGTH=262 /DNA_ID=CAMNT_0006819415 /DNA_START=5 /DNA_END=793 /DNA_ORIENTATION=+